MSSLFAMFGMGHWELLIVLFVMLLLFGGRLPQVMSSLGASLGAFRNGVRDGCDDETQPTTTP